MLRILRRTTAISGLEPPGFIAILPSVTISGVSGQQCSSSKAWLAGNGSVANCRFYSTPARNQNPSVWRASLKGHGGIVSGGVTGGDKNLLSDGITSLMLEQSRGYWGKEGRIAWRRRRGIERMQREKILNPNSPVIDQRVPWPKDDFESLPKELFGEEIEELSPTETRDAQNAVLSTINNQINSHAEGRLFVVVHISGKQFKVTPEDIIIVQESFPPTVGDQIRLHKVLMVGGKDFTLLGSPLIDKDLVRVEATVIEKSLSYTKMVFKMIKRKNYKRLRFAKTPYTMLRINLVQLMQPLDMIKSEAESSKHHSSAV